MTRRDIRAQRSAVSESKRIWLLPEPGQRAREELGDVLEDVFRALAEDRDRQRAEKDEQR